MHPAHVLPEGHVRFAGGSAANFVLGDAQTAIDEASLEPTSVAVDRPSETYARGALAVASMAPGVSPLLAARVGLAWVSEGGLTYTGRLVRIDARKALEWDSIALSVGIGGSAVLSRRGAAPDATLGGLNIEAASGWGADVPVVFGWRSAADVVWWWGGVRGGYEHLQGHVALERQAPSEPLEGDIDGARTSVTALTGLALGFRYVHAAIEVQGGYQHAAGTLWDQDVSVSGFTLAPSAALLGKF
jgi:hypothetical protein